MAKPKTLTEVAYENIKQWIMEGQIAPGCKISLEETASRLEVSMTPIREALTKLQQDGLVEYIPRSGWRAARLSKKTYFKYRELQLLLELNLTELAFPYVTDEAIEAMKEANERLRHDLDSLPKKELPRAILKENDTIHMTLFSCYGNEVMTNMLQNVWDSMSYYRMVMFSTNYYREIGYKDHEHIIEAIKRNDAQAVRYAMEHHLVNGPICLEESFDEDL
ncbi:MAG: GntR family transcriptional regulator [Cloacibacillus sp.]